MIAVSEINDAYHELNRTQRGAYLQAERAIQAKANLEIKLLHRLADGSIEGKNQQLRDAAALALLADDYAALEIAEADSRAAKLELDLAWTEVNRIKALLRLAELD